MKQAESQVRRLQMRIAKAIQEGKHGKAKSLQWILTHLYYAKLLAVKRVAQNTGAKTPGVDGILWKGSKQKFLAAKSLHRRGYKAQPLRRIYIPKSNGNKRPLGIPTMNDRAMQALYLLALEPIAEVTADKHSYVFRPKRSAADAIRQCFLSLARKNSAQWVLEGDIKACFYDINHSWLLASIPKDKMLLRQWLMAGYIKDDTFYETNAGTPQGGVISPMLVNMALDGLDKVIREATARPDKINVVKYADDFVITGSSKAVLEQKVKPAVIRFLTERGLILSEEKITITHIDQGIDFLGFNLRKYNGKLLIKPSRGNVTAFLGDMRQLIKSNTTLKTESLIRILNPRLRGWANYYRHVVSKATFSKVDYAIFIQLDRWTKRRHPQKSVKWLRDKYFCHPALSTWHFHARLLSGDGQLVLLRLMKIASIKIKRHVKIRAEVTPYDPQYLAYFAQRNA